MSPSFSLERRRWANAVWEKLMITISNKEYFHKHFSPHHFLLLSFIPLTKYIVKRSSLLQLIHPPTRACSSHLFTCKEMKLFNVFNVQFFFLLLFSQMWYLPANRKTQTHSLSVCAGLMKKLWYLILPNMKESKIFSIRKNVERDKRIKCKNDDIIKFRWILFINTFCLMMSYRYRFSIVCHFV